MNVIRMKIYQLSNVPSEQNDILTVQFSFKTETNEKKIQKDNIKSVLNLQYKTGTCKYSKRLTLAKQDK